eukprot:scaffold143056_cov31-Tisochrysis_lutea.AAC.5
MNVAGKTSSAAIHVSGSKRMKSSRPSSSVPMAAEEGRCACRAGGHKWSCGDLLALHLGRRDLYISELCNGHPGNREANAAGKAECGQGAAAVRKKERAHVSRSRKEEWERLGERERGDVGAEREKTTAAGGGETRESDCARREERKREFPFHVRGREVPNVLQKWERKEK